jgi:hypothetical protein
MKRRGIRWGREWAAITRGTAFEMAVLSVAMFGIGAAIVATFRAASVRPTDLQFAAAREEIAAIVRAKGDQGIAEPRRAKISHDARIIVFDSLAVTGDSSAVPSLARGGFLRDQVEAYNETAVRNAWRSTLRGRDDIPDALSTSLLRLARTDSATLFLSERLNPYTLVVQAPGISGAGVAVHAADWRHGPALVGLHGETSLPEGNGSASPSAQLSYDNCRMLTSAVTRRLVYCGVSPGISLRTGFDLQIETQKPDAFDGRLQLKEDRRSTLWVNGRKVINPAAARGGDLVYTSRLGPAVLSETETGWLAGPQWVNGRETFQVIRSGTLRWFGRAGRSVPARRTGTTLALSVDAALTGALDGEIGRFMQRNHDYLEAMSVVVMDLATGNLRSLAESDPADDKPLLAFEPLLLGSMSKPLIAAAILSRQPEMAAFTVVRGGPMLDTVAGLRLHAPLGNPANGCPATITFESYLQCSSNQYAAEFFLTSLQRSAGRRQVATRGRVSDAVLESSAVSEGILTLFDDAVLSTDGPLGRSARLWQRDSTSIGADAVPLDQSLQPHLSRPAFMRPDSGGVPVDWLARFAIGGWENRWTLVGALEAYARIATDRRVHLTVLAPAPGASSSGPRVPADAASAYRTVRRGMRLAATGGTAAGLDSVMRGLGSTSAPLVVLAKTGTLNEDAERAGDTGVFLKSLAIMVGAPESQAEGAPLRCGLGMIVYLQFRQDWRELQQLPEGTKLPDLHRAFATGELARTLRSYWTRSEPCARKTK